MDRQLGAGVTQQHGVGCGGVGALTALRGVPDKVVFAVGVFGVCYGLFNGLAGMRWLTVSQSILRE